LTQVIVNLENVCREYDKGRIQAVQSVSLQIKYGEFLAICGASGSGKSTLLNLMTGLDVPSLGRVLIDGVVPVGSGQWSKLRARKFGFIFQGFNLLPTLTALENIMVPMFGLRKSALDREKRAIALLERVGLSDRADHLPPELSGGERQRVAIARGLANDPDILVADEPTGNLDRRTSRQIMELITEIHRVESKTIVLVTHDQRFVSHAERVVSMSDGKLVDRLGD
jgi:putative ABC transport system ATP-binding protein